MNIVDIIEQEDGTTVAVIEDGDGNIVGYNTYGPESYPRPKLGLIKEAGVFRRFWTWLTYPGQDTPA